MSNFFDQLEAQLQAAARERARRPGLRGLRGAAPILAAIAVALAVAVVALTSIEHGHAGGAAGAPGTSANQLAQASSYLAAARRAALRSGACRRAATGPAFDYGTPSRVLLSSLAVLRRPPAASDKLPGSLHGQARGIYVRYVRLARVKDGVSYYVVPAASVNPFRSLVTLTPRCRAAMTTALRTQLHIPAKLRARALALLPRSLPRRGAVADLEPVPGICLLVSGAGGSGATCTGTPSVIAKNGIVSVLGPAVGVVPDGVASVTVSYPSGQGLPARTASSDVVGNVFVTALRHPRRTPWPTIIWRSAQGNVIKTIPATDRIHGGTSGFCGGPPAGSTAPKPC